MFLCAKINGRHLRLNSAHMHRNPHVANFELDTIRRHAMPDAYVAST